ncbi:unnamed protein product, partial [Symbiodinium sp. KB8]
MWLEDRILQLRSRVSLLQDEERQGAWHAGHEAIDDVAAGARELLSALAATFPSLVQAVQAGTTPSEARASADIAAARQACRTEEEVVEALQGLLQTDPHPSERSSAAEVEAELQDVLSAISATQAQIQEAQAALRSAEEEAQTTQSQADALLARRARLRVTLKE